MIVVPSRFNKFYPLCCTSTLLHTLIKTITRERINVFKLSNEVIVLKDHKKTLFDKFFYALVFFINQCSVFFSSHKGVTVLMVLYQLYKEFFYEVLNIYKVLFC